MELISDLHRFLQMFTKFGWFYLGVVCDPHYYVAV